MNRLAVIGIGVAVTYIMMVASFGFAGPIAIAINFMRVALAVAVLIIYLPNLKDAFKEVPPPRGDYLLAGIVLTWLSACCFAISNEAGRVLHVTNSVYINPLSGSFSLMLVLGGAFHLLAPGTTSPSKSLAAIIVGVAVGMIVVFVIPMFG